MIGVATPPKAKASGSALVAGVRRIVTGLFQQEWPRAYADGLRALVRQLSALERSEAPAVDEALLEALLPAIDALERARAQAFVKDPGWARRFDQALDALVRLLARYDVHPDRCLGAEFDPAVHEAVDVLETKHVPSGRIVRVIERGWRLGNTPVRLSKVVVSEKIQAAA